MKRNRWRILWLLVGLALLAWVVWRADPAKAAAAMLDAFAHPGLLAGAVGLFAATLVGFFIKWHLMSRLAGAPVDARQSLRLFSTLYLVGTFTPGRAGELVVPMLMRGGGQLTGVALVNRVLESLWTVFAAALAAWMIFRGDPTRSGRLWILLVILAAFVVAAVILSRRRLTAGLVGLVRACLAPFRRLAPVAWLLRLEEKHAHGLEQFYDANERILRPAPVLLVSLLLAAIWLMMILANWLLVSAVVPPGEKEITFLVVFAVMVVGAAAMFLSPIPGGVGLSEFTSVALFGYLGYPQPEFVSFLLLARLILYAMVGVLYVVGQVAGRALPGAAVPAGAAPHD
ncbi:MAG: lysylphosphatidylglycerol synthase transmembrane domain-containing protein, partial [Phycisphaerae bacterium]